MSELNLPLKFKIHYNVSWDVDPEIVDGILTALSEARDEIDKQKIGIAMIGKYLADALKEIDTLKARKG